jgi:hypothetical protein
MLSPAFETNLSSFISSLIEGNLFESAATFISCIYATEGMLELLQRLEEIRVDPCYAEAQVRNGYNCAICLLAESRGELLLTTIIKHKKQYYLNLFSIGNSYSQILNPSFDCKSGLYYLQQTIPTKFGIAQLGRSLHYLIPLLGFPMAVLDSIDEFMDPLILRVYLNCEEALNEVITNIVEFLSVQGLPRNMLDAFIDILWNAEIYDHLCELEGHEKNTPAVASLLVYHSDFLSTCRYRTLHDHDQLDLIIEAMKILEKERKHEVFLWRFESDKYLALDVDENSPEYRDGLCSFIDFIEDSCRDDYLFYVNESVLEVLAQNLAEEDGIKVVDYYIQRMGDKEPTVKRLSILEWLQFCLEGPKLPELLKTKLFTSDVINASPKMSKCIEEFFIYHVGWTEKVPLKVILDYCVTKPLILCEVYKEIANFYPLDARHAEDAVVEHLLKNKDQARLEVVCHFNDKNRSRFFQKVHDSVTTASKLPITTDDSYHNRCIKKNIILGNSEKDRILSLMALAPET